MPLPIRIQLWMLKIRRQMLNTDITECMAHINELRCYMQQQLELDDKLRHEEIALEIQLRYRKVSPVKMSPYTPKKIHQPRRTI